MIRRGVARRTAGRRVLFGLAGLRIGMVLGWAGLRVGVVLASAGLRVWMLLAWVGLRVGMVLGWARLRVGVLFAWARLPVGVLLDWARLQVGMVLASAGLRVGVVLGLVAALIAPAEPAAGLPGRYVWPLAPPHPVVRAFSAPATPYGPGHRGVDLGGTAGEAVFAAGGGTVVFAGPVGGRPVVSLAHDSGLRTTYEPVRPVVHAGSPVGRGQQIGTLLAGHEGCPVAVCLHWGARRGLDYVNPVRLVTSGRVRLLPLTPVAEPRRTG